MKLRVNYIDINKLLDLLYELLQRVVVPGHDELIQVNESDVREAVHGAVEAVVEGGEQTLGAYLSLRDDVEFPGQHSDSALSRVVGQHTAHLGRGGVVVEHEVRHT